MKKQWPLTLIKRGVKVGTTSKYPETIWWQESNPEAPTASSARNIGYEAYDMVPVSYAERIAGSAENLIRVHGLGGPNASPEVEDLQMVIDSFRDNVRVNKTE